MRIIKRILGCSIFLLAFSVSVHAEIPDGTFVVNNKAYDLQLVMDEEWLDEIKEGILSSEYVYVKTFTGKWIDNFTEKEISKDMIPEVTYYSTEGVTKTFEKGDGKEKKEEEKKEDIIIPGGGGGGSIIPPPVVDPVKRGTFKFNAPKEVNVGQEFEVELKVSEVILKGLQLDINFGKNISVKDVSIVDKFKDRLTLLEKNVDGKFTIALVQTNHNVDSETSMKELIIKDESIIKIKCVANNKGAFTIGNKGNVEAQLKLSENGDKNESILETLTLVVK